MNVLSSVCQAELGRWVRTGMALVIVVELLLMVVLIARCFFSCDALERFGSVYCTGA